MTKKKQSVKTHGAGIVMNSDFSADFQQIVNMLMKSLSPDDASQWLKETYSYAMEPSFEIMKAWMDTGAGKHGRTGRTLKSFYDGKLVWTDNGDRVEFLYGFHKKKGGLPALFLEYGTPRIEPEFVIHWAVKDHLDVISARLMTKLAEKWKEVKT